MSIRVKYDTFTESLIMSNDTSSPSQIIIPNWAMDLITKDYKHEIDRLKVENAKLRELAKAAWGCVNRHVSCDECRMVSCGCTLQSAMRELGIEVNE